MAPFKKPKELKTMLTRSLEYIKVFGEGPLEYAELFMQIFEKTKGKRSMKGLVMGKANVECYLCVHPKFLKLILDQCPEKERKGAQERIVLAILQKKLSVNFKYELTQSGILRP